MVRSRMRPSIIALAIVAAACGGSQPAAPTTSSTPREAPTISDETTSSIVTQQPLGSPGDSRAWLVVYPSETIHGEPTTVTGWVAVPAGEPPAEGWPMLAYGHPTSGLGDQCAPSVRGRTSPLQFADALDRGWAVSASDYEGLGGPGLHPYMVGGSEARSVLNLIAAAKAIDGVRLSGKVGLWGFSQGGHAVLFAAELAPILAPELEIVGVAAVAPAMDLAPWPAAALDTPQQGIHRRNRGFLRRGVPARAVDDPHRTGLGYVDEITTSCTDPTGQSVAFARSDDVFVSNPGTTEPWAGLLLDNSPGSVMIDAPVLLVLGTEDDLFPADFRDEAMEILCAPGTNVITSVYQGASHTGVASSATPEILDFVDDRLAGVPAPEGCR